MNPNKSDNTAVPEGFMRDAHQRLVPLEVVEPIDQLRDQVVRTIVASARETQAVVKRFKAGARADVENYADLAAEKYGAKIGGKKGNISLTSYDGTLKVQVAVSENIRFDERIQAAKALIDECIHEWTADSSNEVKAIVDHAFQTDKEGKISIGRILGLTRLKIDHPKWLQAIEAIRDSIQVLDTAEYMRMYERPTPKDKWQAIPLDIAKL